MTGQIFSLRAVTSFFWNGENGQKSFIRKGEIIEGDSAFKTQVVDEEGLCELVGEAVK